MNKNSSTKLPNSDEEIKAFNNGYDFIVGLDEVGRGCFAGPVTVGAVVIRKKDLLNKDNPCKS